MLSLTSTATIRSLARFFSIAALCFATPTCLWAAAINIDDTSPDETITISVNDFEYGFDLNGTQFQSGLHNPATATFPEGGPIDFVGTWVAPGAAPVNQTIYLVEQLSGPLLPTTQISDILQFAIEPNADETATISGSFVSANDLGPLPPNVDPAFVYFEDGNPVDLGFAALGISIKSDAVPEPANVCLAALGLIGLVTTTCRRRERFV